MSQDKLHQIIAAIESIPDNLGIYPRAVQGFMDERDYEQRDGYRNGWNAAVEEISRQWYKVLDRDVPSHNHRIFAAFTDWFAEGETGYVVVLNDVWFHAAGDAEEIPLDKEQELIDLFLKHGENGIILWVYNQRGQLPNVQHYRTIIENMLSQDGEQQ